MSDAGWSELAAGQWDAARRSFERAVAVEGTPEAHEGLSWAAWWRDDADAVFRARRAAFRLYKARGDAPGAARMATWLACDELDFNGAGAVASGWLGRAHGLLDPLDEVPEHGWLAFFDGYLARGAGDIPRALERAAAAAAVGRRHGVPELEMLGLALEGSTLVACVQVEEGMRRLDAATVTAIEGEAEIPIAGAWACCFLVTACAAVRDYERASEWCERIAEFAARYGSRYMLAFCRAEYGAVQLWRGDWVDAERMFEAAVEDFTRSRPAMVGAPLAGLAELRRRQGRGAEADTLLASAGDVAAAQLCVAQQALDRGEPRRTVELVERMLRRLPPQSVLERAAPLELLIRARTIRGELAEADEALQELTRIEGLVGTEALHASKELAEGALAAARGEYARARTLLEDAVDRFERSGGRFEAALARVELGATLLALGRTEDAVGELETALDRLVALGAAQGTDVARRLLESSKRPGGAAGRLADLTPREQEVLRLLAEGITNRQIAERLVVSEHTVHRHVTNILRKLDVPTRTAAAAHAVRAGVVDERGG